MLNIDQTTEFGKRVACHLDEEVVVWLTTCRPGGAPQPSPVWFLWREHDGSLLIYSQPNTPKLRNIGANSRVALNFNCTAAGGDVVVMTGRAEIMPDAPAANAVEDYLGKYSHGIERLGMTPEAFARSYSVAIRVTPTSLRGF